MNVKVKKKTKMLRGPTDEQGLEVEVRAVHGDVGLLGVSHQQEGHGDVLAGNDEAPERLHDVQLGGHKLEPNLAHGKQSESGQACSFFFFFFFFFTLCYLLPCRKFNSIQFK